MIRVRAVERKMERILAQWGPSRNTELFGNQPICVQHRLPQHPLFSRDALAELIERYPEDKYMLVNTGERGSPRKLWRQGKIGTMPGHAVIDAVAKGRFWLNLLRVNEVDTRYQELLDQLYAEIHANVPTYPNTYKRICGILISSPQAQVYYHFDTQGNNLWQIAGSKRVYLYPATPPFVTDELVEKITLYHDETSIPYQPWYDDYATVFELQPGQMLHWALNAPHRIENNDELSISLTTEYVTKEIRRHVLATSGNGLLREVGMKPGLTLGGPAFLAKAALFAAAKKSGLLKARQKPEIAFRLDQPATM
jgi:hypothetical protein